jgi:hypothetical protein
MTSGFGGWWRLALAASSMLGAAGCGESFVSGSGGAAAGGGGSGGTATTSTGGATGGSSTGGGGAGGNSMTCPPGNTEACYTADPGTLGKGVCTAGTKECDQAGEWGPCVGEVVPALETCDGQDNDCDEELDEGCPCVDGETCYPFGGTPGQGACKTGIKVCSGGELVECQGAVGPTDEICNGEDDDCDTTPDDVPGLGNACSIAGAQGVCAVGELHCNIAEMLVDCATTNVATNETCNGLDDDCNGLTDDLLTQTCTLDVPSPGGSVSCKGHMVCDAGGQAVCSRRFFFEDDFSDGSAGWDFDAGWEISSATVSPQPDQGNPDPAEDHTASADNGVAGAIIGGNLDQPQLMSYLTSPSIDVKNWPTLYLSYWRWLNANTSDGVNYIHHVQVSKNNGVDWTNVFINNNAGVYDNEWMFIVHDLSPYVGTSIRVRFGFQKFLAIAPSVSSWNIDDLVVSSCPPPPPVP